MLTLNLEQGSTRGQMQEWAKFDAAKRVSGRRERSSGLGGAGAAV